MSYLKHKFSCFFNLFPDIYFLPYKHYKQVTLTKQKGKHNKKRKCKEKKKIRINI